MEDAEQKSVLGWVSCPEALAITDEPLDRLKSDIERALKTVHT